MAGTRQNQRAVDTTLAPLGGRQSSKLPVVVLTVSVLAGIWALAMLTAPGRVGVAYVFYFLQFYAGVFTLVSLSITVMAGVLATDRLVLMVRHRVLLQSVHRTLGTMAVIFLFVHIFSKVLYGAVPVIGVIVPFTGGNRPVYVGLGILAGYLMVMILWTGIARARFIGRGKPWMWRAMHATVYVSWPLALVHGLSAGRPAAGWVVASYLACVLLVTIVLIVRVSVYLQKRSRGQLGSTTGSMKPVGKMPGASPAGTGSGFRYVAESDIRAAYAPREQRQPVRQAATAYEQRVASYEQLGGRPPREYQTEEEYAVSRPPTRGPAPYEEPGYAQPGYAEPGYDEPPGPSPISASARPVSAPVTRPVSAPASRPVSAPASRPVSAPASRPVSAPTSRPVSAPTSRPVSAPTSRPVSGPVTRPVSGSGRRAAAEPGYEPEYGAAGHGAAGFGAAGYEAAEQEYVGRRSVERRGRRDEDEYRPARYRAERESRPEFPASAPPRRRFEEGYAGADHSMTSYTTGGYSVADYAAPTSPPPTGTPWRESTSEFSAVDENGQPGPRARTRAGRHSRDGEPAGYGAGYPASSPVSAAYPPPSYQHDDARYEEPRYEEPRYEEPRYQEPRYEEPRYQGQGYEEPRYQQGYEEPRGPYQERYEDYVEPDDTPTLVDMASRRAMRAERGEPAGPRQQAPRQQAQRRRGGAGRSGSGGGGMRNLTEVSDEEYWAQLRGEAR